MKYILGTAQFGLDYGVSNNNGKINDEEIIRILKCANNCGVEYLDTANVYGDSETKIGQLSALTKKFKLITKTAHTKLSNSAKENIQLINHELNQSLKKMQRRHVDILLIHNVEDILSDDGAEIYQSLEKIKSSGLTKKIGVSVYDVEELVEVISKYSVDIVQFPLNVFNQTFHRSGILTEIKIKGVELHARSVFLQGLLLMQRSHIDAYFEPIKPVISEYLEFLEKVNLNPVEGALNYVKQVQEVDAVIFGVQDCNQLIETVHSLESKAVTVDYKDFAILEKNMINPSMWEV